MGWHEELHLAQQMIVTVQRTDTFADLARRSLGILAVHSFERCICIYVDMCMMFFADQIVFSFANSNQWHDFWSFVLQYKQPAFPGVPAKLNP